MKKGALLLTGLVFLIGLMSFKKDDIKLKDILQKVSAFIAKNPYEKVYLHLDKSYYLVGDDWNPQVSTDESGAFPIQYYNNDKPGKYRIVVEGMDEDGNLTRKVLNYLVK